MIIKSFAITCAIAWLCYRSFWALLFFPFVFYVMKKFEEGKRKVAKKKKLKEEFLNGISVLNTSLQAGLSMENAWKEVEKETRILYGEQSEFYLELREVNYRVLHNAPIEKLLLEFAYKCKVEEVIQFAELMEYGKRSGGNWKHIIDVTVSQMMERHEVKQQIEVIVAEKKLEQQVMNIMPLGILAFLQISAWDYMSALYHNWFGVICMTVFLIGYIAAFCLSQKILKVEL